MNERPLGEIIELPRIADPRGNLTIAEQFRHIPFEIKRVYWTYDVPGGESRGGHAHRHCRSVVVAVSGSFDVVLDNGRQKQTYHMNQDRKSTRLNSSHANISYAVFCLKKKKTEEKMNKKKIRDVDK